jgi:hypothetical protein
MQLEVSTNHGTVLLFILDMFGAFKIRKLWHGRYMLYHSTKLFYIFLNIRDLAPVPFH